MFTHGHVQHASVQLGQGIDGAVDMANAAGVWISTAMLTLLLMARPTWAESVCMKWLVLELLIDMFWYDAVQM